MNGCFVVNLTDLSLPTQRTSVAAKKSGKPRLKQIVRGGDLAVLYAIGRREEMERLPVIARL